MFDQSQLAMIVNKVVADQYELQAKLPQRTGGISLDVRALATNTGHERFHRPVLINQIRQAFAQVGLPIREMYDGVVAVEFEGITVGSDTNGLYVHVAERGTFSLPVISPAMKEFTVGLFEGYPEKSYEEVFHPERVKVAPQFTASQLAIIVHMVVRNIYNEIQAGLPPRRGGIAVNVGLLARANDLTGDRVPLMDQVCEALIQLGLTARAAIELVIVEHANVDISATATGFVVTSAEKGEVALPTPVGGVSLALSSIFRPEAPWSTPVSMQEANASTDPYAPNPFEAALWSRFHKLITHPDVPILVLPDDLVGVGQFGKVLYRKGTFAPVASWGLPDGREAVVIYAGSEPFGPLEPVVIAEMVYDAHGMPVQLFAERRTGTQSVTSSPLVHDPFALNALRAACAEILDGH